jgi:hypothetical protein
VLAGPISAAQEGVMMISARQTSREAACFV